MNTPRHEVVNLSRRTLFYDSAWRRRGEGQSRLGLHAEEDVLRDNECGLIPCFIFSHGIL